MRVAGAAGRGRLVHAGPRGGACPACGRLSCPEGGQRSRGHTGRGAPSASGWDSAGTGTSQRGHERPRANGLPCRAGRGLWRSWRGLLTKRPVHSRARRGPGEAPRPGLVSPLGGGCARRARVPPWAVRVPAWGCPHPPPQHVSAPGHDSVLASGKLTRVLGNKRWQGSRGAPLPSCCTGPEGPRGGKGPHAPEACTTPRQDRSSLGSLLPSGSICCE